MQNIIVGLIVALACAYAIWRFMPGGVRQTLARGMAALGRQIGLSESRAQRLERKLESSGSCGSCDSCKACATPAERSGQPLHFHK